jgi:Acyl-protein synthetase, LuxE
MLSCWPAVAENQPANKYRMNKELSSFAARLCGLIASGFRKEDFDALALELFALQFEYNAFYQKFCGSRKMTPAFAGQWSQIPFIPTVAFKTAELTCIPFTERTTIFHSSGTTGHNPGCHHHNAASLAVYQASLWTGFEFHFGKTGELVFLSPAPNLAPHSSLVHMFEIVRQKFGLPASAFTGNIAADGSWLIDFSATIKQLKNTVNTGQPLTLLGTVFSFVHLLDYLMENDWQISLPPNSRVMETGGYKNRSRAMPKAELHSLITHRLGITPDNIICEYGMSELSSQAYTGRCERQMLKSGGGLSFDHHFHFPPWARVQVISPENGQEVGEGETGLVRVFDLANVFSVAAIQTEDLGIRRGNGFELIGRAQLAEPRGCSLMTA